MGYGLPFFWGTVQINVAEDLELNPRPIVQFIFFRLHQFGILEKRPILQALY